MNHPNSATSSRRQPQRIPPPLTFGDERLDAEVVLRELGGDLALLLWKTVRSVRLWGEIPAAERGEAFLPEAHARRMEEIGALGLPEEISEPLAAAARVLFDPTAEPAQIADACRRAARWAEERGAVGTALELSQAAALVHRADAELAYAVARLARRRAEYPRSETWYRQAISAARRGSQWTALARSCLGLGILQMQRGNYPAAQVAIMRGLRAARRHSLPSLVALAYHDLTAVAVHTNRERDVATYARAALNAYGPGHERLPHLAHDVAVFWMNRGYFGEALRVFLSLPTDLPDPADRLTRAASLVRAAAAAGDGEVYRSSWEEATTLMQNPATAERAVCSMVEMARGAEMMREWDRAEGIAEEALGLARTRGEGEKRIEAESLLEAIRRSRRLSERPATAAKRPPRHVGHLADAFSSALATAGPA